MHLLPRPCTQADIGMILITKQQDLVWDELCRVQQLKIG